MCFDYLSPRGRRRAEDRWLANARKLLLEDDRYDDKLYTWACALNGLLVDGKITYRMANAPLHPELCEPVNPLEDYAY